MYGELPDHYYTERGREIPGPSWSGDEIAAMDDDDLAAVRAAMDNSVAMRHHAEMQRMEREIIRLQDLLADNDIDYEEEPYGYDQD
jgi:hypothetical protein